MNSFEVMPHDSFENEQSKSVRALFDFLIPPHPERGLPGGSHVKLSYNSLIDDCLKVLDEASNQKYAKKFYALQSEEKAFLAANLSRVHKTWFTRLAKVLAESYYQQGHAPFPEGFHVEEGDLMLLEPVYLRGKMYREI